MTFAVQRTFDDLGTPLADVTFVVVDVETTGGAPSGSRLTEVAAARYRGGELLGTFQTLVRPDERIPPNITALTGISEAMVADAPPAGAILPALLEFVGDGVIVGHNIRFDLSFLDHALRSTDRQPLSGSHVSVDTLALARRLVRDEVADCKLGTLAHQLRLPHRPSHRALADVLATGDLLHLLLERAGTYGITGLAELLDLPRLVGHPQAAKLRLTTRLPHRPGVYWFTDAAGNVLYVGKATDLQARVRSYFSSDDRRKIGRLLRQLHAVHHRTCPGTFTAEVLEGRLIRAWDPPFNRQGKVRRSSRNGMAPAVTPAVTPASAPAPTPWRSARRRRGARADSVDALETLLTTMAELARSQQYEEAAACRDEAIRMRGRMVAARRTDAWRSSGQVTVTIADEAEVVLDGGVVAGIAPDAGAGVHRTGAGTDGPSERIDAGPVRPSTSRPAGARGPDGAPERSRPSGSMGRAGPVTPLDVPVDERDEGREAERVIVARWLEVHADRVQIVALGDGAAGPATPVVRLPEVRGSAGSSDLPGPPASAA